jgi:hypothetical protein
MDSTSYTVRDAIALPSICDRVRIFGRAGNGTVLGSLNRLACKKVLHRRMEGRNTGIETVGCVCFIVVILTFESQPLTT